MAIFRADRRKNRRNPEISSYFQYETQSCRPESRDDLQASHRCVGGSAQNFHNRVAGRRDDLIGFGPGQAKRRRQTDDIALRHGPGDHAALQHRGDGLGADPLTGVKELPPVTPGHQLDRA